MPLREVHDIRPQWSALADEVDARPFDRPEWVDAWMRAFGRGRLALATHERDGRLTAVLPLARTLGRLRSATTWLAPELPLAAADAAAREALLIDVFALRSPRVEIEFLPGDAVYDPEAVVAERGAWRKPLVRPAARAPYVELSGTFAEYEATLSRNRRRSLRRAWRRLHAAGPVTLDVWRGGDDLDARLQEVLAVEAAGWKGRGGTAIASSPATRTFYAEIAAWGAARHWLRLSCLRVAGRAIAADIGLVQGGTWYSLRAGYDERWREFGPGALLVHALLERAYDEGVQRFDFLGDADPFKDSWATASRSLVRIEAFRPTPSGALGLAHTLLRPAVHRLATAAAGGAPARAPVEPVAGGPGVTPRP
jgi:CelD/BcsL family acetyltransferase involved in cellulose biosynthesis